jgi:protoporphyrinogen oxidase
MSKSHVVILGAGPAGLGAAFKLARRGGLQVTVLEQNRHVGGNAGSFDLAGMRVDYGSHRLHPSCVPEVLNDIRTLLGDHLLDRPRHGRIRICGRWIHFPLKPVDLAVRLPLRFSAGVATDLIRKSLGNGRSPNHNETFASVLEHGLGRTICENFYFPYVEKIWGVGPEQLAVTLAHRRVGANSLSKMTQKIFAAALRSETNGRGRFFYPRNGYGEISEAYYGAARESGAEVRLGARVQALVTENNAVKTVYYEQDGRVMAIPASHVWSTIPITVLARCLKPSVSAEIAQAAEQVRYRAMILVYLVLEQERFSEFDAHYFPDGSIPISRLSEPKNYRAGHGPKGSTVLCAELPCAAEGSEWNMSNGDLAQLVCGSLETAAIPVRATIKEVATRRLRQAYPIYHRGYESYFDSLDRWIGQIDGLLTFGRQGLFAHDNTHHALYMAYSAVDCLDEKARFNRERWQSTFRRIFETHVVED